MADNHFLQVGVVSDVPFSMTSDYLARIELVVNQEYAQFCTEPPFPPEATGMKSGLEAQLRPQLHVIVTLGVQ